METGSDAPTPIGAIVGGVAAAVLILVGLLCLYIRKKKKTMSPPLSVKAVDTKPRDLELASKEAEPPTTSTTPAPETPGAPGTKTAGVLEPAGEAPS